MSGKYAALFTPMHIGKLEIKNRIVMCAMGGSPFINPDGSFNERLATYYIERAKGGTGLIISGLTTVQDSSGAGVWFHNSRDNFIPGAKKMMEKIHSYGTKMFIQLGAGMGRVLPLNLYASAEGPLAYLGLNEEKAIVAPSDNIPNYWLPDRMHRALTKEEIQAIIDGYRKSAKMIQEAGFDGIEIHAVHEGYLLDQFAIEATNHRTDEYGGSLENRLRFVCEIIQAIKEVCGQDYPVAVRYSVASKMKGFNSGALPGEAYKEFGRSLEESPRVAQILEEAGCDALGADNGSYDAWYWAHPPMYMPMACNLPEAVYIKNFVNIPVYCGGRMEDPEIAAKAIESGNIDGVGIGRQLLADPYWPEKVKQENLADIRPCIACHNGCFARVFLGKEFSCALNPAVLHEEDYRLVPAQHKKKIIVVGGGIGGMEVTRLCALRGHEVTLYEKSEELGGVFIAAAAPDFKEADKKLLQWYIKQITDLNVKVIMNTEATAELIKQASPDAVIIASGSTPKKLSIPGFDSPKTINAIEMLLEQKPVGEKAVVVGGGLTGCEIAYDLAKNDKKVTIVEIADDILKVPGLCAANSNMLRGLLIYHEVEVLKSTELKEITSSGVTVAIGNQEKEIEADTVIVAVGYDSYAPLVKELTDLKEVYVVGDASQVGNLMDVVWAAYDVALKL